MKKHTLQELYQVIASLRTPRELEEFMRGLLTPMEIKRIATRWRLVCLLAVGARQRDIAQKLHVSLCNITRGSRELKIGPECFRNCVGKAVGRKRLVLARRGRPRSR